MNSKILLAACMTLFMSSGVMAEDLNGSSFPYGLLELRGYAMEMSEEGAFRIYSDATTFVEGTFSIEGDKMMIHDRGGMYACRGKRAKSGSYYWTVREQNLFLELIKDNCGARRTAFLEAPLKIASPVK